MFWLPGFCCKTPVYPGSSLSSLSSPSVLYERLSAGLKVSVLSTEQNTVLDLEGVHFLFSWQHYDMIALSPLLPWCRWSRMLLTHHSSVHHCFWFLHLEFFSFLITSSADKNPAYPSKPHRPFLIPQPDMNLLSASGTALFTVFSDQIPLPSEARTSATPSSSLCPRESVSKTSLRILALMLPSFVTKPWKWYAILSAILVGFHRLILIQYGQPHKDRNPRKLGSLEDTLKATIPALLRCVFVQVTNLSRPQSLIRK